MKEERVLTMIEELKDDNFTFDSIEKRENTYYRIYWKKRLVTVAEWRKLNQVNFHIMVPDTPIEFSMNDDDVPYIDFKNHWTETYICWDILYMALSEAKDLLYQYYNFFNFKEF